MKELPLNGFYKSESKKLSDRRCINWMPTLSDNGALSTFSLMPTSGVKYLLGDNTIYNSDLDDGEVNGEVASFDGFNSLTQYVVGGYLIGCNGDAISFNTLPSTPVVGGSTASRKCRLSRFATDGNVLVFAGPGYANSSIDRGYQADSTLTVSAIDFASSFGTNRVDVVDVAYLGGRFLYLAANKTAGYNRVHYSGLGTVEPNNLDFFAPQGNDEQLYGLEVLNNRLYLFAETNIYIYTVSTSLDTPFVPAGAIPYGLAGDFRYEQMAKTRYAGTVAFYGKQKNGASRVYLMSGSGAQPISTHNIDRVLAQNSGNIRLFSFTEKGRSFLCVRSDSSCFVYEMETQQWHERITYPDSTWAFVGATELSNGEGSLLIGDSIKTVPTGFGSDYAFFNCGITDINSGTELASSINESNNLGLVERTVVTSPFNASNDRMVLSELEPQLDVNFTSPVDGWNNCNIFMSISYDFANTFESERSVEFTANGSPSKRSRFIGIGYVEQAFVCKFRTFNPYPVSFVRLLSRTTKGYS